jgi:hypothetical protein
VRREIKKPAPVIELPGGSDVTQMPSLPVEEVLSFLKEMRGALTWTVGDMARSLRISHAEARKVVVIFELQGYVKPALDNDGWLTTLDGESLSGSKSPRFNPERVNESLEALKDLIRTNNLQKKSAFQITQAVAFGDFLIGRAQVQAADVGVQIVSRKEQRTQGSKAAAEGPFLKELKADTSVRLPTMDEPKVTSSTNLTQF